MISLVNCTLTKAVFPNVNGANVVARTFRDQQMKNIPIIGKFLAIMATFGAFSIAVALYAGYQISNIDREYSSLLTGETAASMQVVRANRALQSARAAISEIIMSRTDELTKAATEEFAASRKSFEQSADLAIAAAPADMKLKELKESGLTLLDQACQATIAKGASARNDADVTAAQSMFLAECQPAFKTLSAQFVAESTLLADMANKQSDLLSEASSSTITTTIALVLAGLAIVVAGGFFGIRAWLVAPIKSLAHVMATLAGGELSAIVDGTDRKDEVGGMAKAVQVFKDNGLKARELEQDAANQRNMTEEERRRNAEIERLRADAMAAATTGLANGLKHLASGDLTFQLSEPFASDFESLRADFNAAVAQLSETLSAVANATNQIDGGTREISQSAEDLSKRTEQQASSLEETAAALDQITTNVANSSKRADEARAVAIEANKSAAESGKVVANAVDAMEKIEQSSNQISNIIGVIDEIAFQTNLLALNAGVEAARAGDAGKGFAVVAQEVRELAQRSAQAAKEIKELIRNSSVEVEGGVKLVRETGQALKSIETHVVTINAHMEAIATSSREQSVGLAEVNTAVNQMDQVTQQNAAMVEESTAASATLAGEAARLRDLIGQFQLDGAAAHGRAHRASVTPVASNRDHKPAVSPVRKMAGKLAMAFGGTAAAANTWEEF
jgi:methyl-accepting chemotaxis protein